MIYGDGSHCPFKYAIMMLLRIRWLERLEDIFAFEYRGIGRKLVQFLHLRGHGHLKTECRNEMLLQGI